MLLMLQKGSWTTAEEDNEEHPRWDKSRTTEPGDMVGVIADAQAEICVNTTPKAANSNIGNEQEVCCVAISITLFLFCWLLLTCILYYYSMKVQASSKLEESVPKVRPDYQVQLGGKIMVINISLLPHRNQLQQSSTLRMNRRYAVFPF